jgi:hypothetical protein
MAADNTMQRNLPQKLLVNDHMIVKPAQERSLEDMAKCRKDHHDA